MVVVWVGVEVNESGVAGSGSEGRRWRRRRWWGLCWRHFVAILPLNNQAIPPRSTKTSALSTGLPGNGSPLHQLANQSLSAHPLRWISVKSWGCPGVSVPAGVSYACSSSTVASCPGVRPITGGRIQNTRDGARACSTIFYSPLGPAYDARRRWEIWTQARPA